MPSDDKVSLHRHLIWFLQALPVFPLYGLFWALPVDWASAIGGTLGRFLGPKLGASKRALKGLDLAMPELSDAEKQRIVREVWENLGRLAGEFPHVPTIQSDTSRIDIQGLHHAQAARDDGKPGIFFTAHFGNWELGDVVATRLGFPWTVVYRKADNPFIEKLYAHARRGVIGGMIPKGPHGARDLMKLMRAGGHAAMLLDQKMNDGIAVPFFGHQAMTAPAAAQLALKFDCPLIPVRVQRTKGARFRIIIEPPLKLQQTEDRDADIFNTMTQVNQIMEDWIRETPGQWFWLHRRWPKELYRSR